MPSSQYLHPEFGYLGSTSRWRHDLKVAVVSILFGAIAGAGGLAVLIADHDARTDGPTTSARVEASAAQPASDPAPTAQPTPQASRASLPAPETTPSPTEGASAARPETDGKSNAGQRKLRRRAANDAPAIGSAPVGRSAAPPAPAAGGSDDPQGAASPPSGAAQAKPADAAVPAEPPAPSAAPAKKPQKTARGHSRRRDQEWIEVPAWGEVREDEWRPRGYAAYPNERYGRGGYGHEGRYIRDGFWSW